MAVRKDIQSKHNKHDTPDMHDTHDTAELLLSCLPLMHRVLTRMEREDSRSHEYVHMKSQYSILLLLKSHESLAMSEICRRLGISKPHMTAIVDRLISEGKASREEGRRDRRMTYISLTPKGIRYLSEGRRLIKEVINGNLEKVQRQDRPRLCSALQEINEILLKARG